MKLPRHSLLHAVLALCLLAAQWAAGRHAVEHALAAAAGTELAAAASAGKSGHAPGAQQHCELCLAFGALDAAPSTAHQALAETSNEHLAAIAARVDARRAEFTAYASRAPPPVA